MKLHGWRKTYKNCLVLPISTRCIFFSVIHSTRIPQLSVLDFGAILRWVTFWVSQQSWKQYGMLHILPLLDLAQRANLVGCACVTWFTTTSLYAFTCCADSQSNNKNYALSTTNFAHPKQHPIPYCCVASKYSIKCNQKVQNRH